MNVKQQSTEQMKLISKEAHLPKHERPSVENAGGQRNPTHEIDKQPPQPDERLLTAVGYGDLKKGPVICQRVADTAARAELAKLIRVHITERAADRVRGINKGVGSLSSEIDRTINDASCPVPTLNRKDP